MVLYRETLIFAPKHTRKVKLRRMPVEKIKVLVIEDEALFREVLVDALSREGGLEIVGMTDDAEKAIALARQTKPNVILMDIELAGKVDGIDAALAIKKEDPEIGIVILSAHDNPRYVTSLPLGESAGWAYLLKQTVRDVSAVVQTIEGCARGMVIMDPAVMAKLHPRQGSNVYRLTRRQQDVLRLLAEGFNNATIARGLALTERSVESYINVIYQHLGFAGESEINMRVKAALAFLKSSQRS
jgi:DNA-binding NarL/FixJ family response regulator